jgi:hypothetical protein
MEFVRSTYIYIIVLTVDGETLARRPLIALSICTDREIVAESFG